MTEMQSIMLAVCFGSVVGFHIANIVFLIRTAAGSHREKKRRRRKSEGTD